MASVHEDGEVGFEEGMLWLPSYVLDEACDAKVYTRHRHQSYQPQQLRHHEWLGEPQLQLSNGSSRSYQRAIYAKGGPGMQAIFLESGHSSCGTGVFLPQKAGSKKPACAPVLLPARVVRALNLNVQALGLQVSPRQDPKYYQGRCEEVYYNSSIKKNECKDRSKRWGVISQNQSYSPEIFLPEEWTY